MLKGTSKIRENGHLEIGGVDTVRLGEDFGTPLFVYDVSYMREQARAFKNALHENGMRAQVSYASKAFSCVAMIQLMQQEGLNLDVVSGGELYTALEAGFEPQNIHFHGNNKSPEEIEMGVRAGIGVFVVDNFRELALLEASAQRHRVTLTILLRITPGVAANTHHYIATGQEDSKFGFDLQNGQVFEALSYVWEHDSFHCLGLHFHIGSQNFDTEGIERAIRKTFSELAKHYPASYDLPEVLNLGGGFGIQYVEEDTPLTVREYIANVSAVVKQEADRYNVSVPEIWIEPGRAIAGGAGTTLYTVGSQKQVPGVRRYVAVDGGMTDNLRPALYGARYEGMLANRGLDANEQVASIAGKCCESGDMLIWDLPLPEVGNEDILAVFNTGAYGYSMASHYNRLPKPAVVFVENAKAQLVVRRETYQDLLQFDLPLEETGIHSIES